ncbi:MAG: peptidylprolyl isomerase [Deltaproteobacteria bacterium]|nr:peptidylprolyl isomerase [Deltaproteobacteria bacterium]
MQIESRKVVTLEYTLTDEGGDVLDTSKGGEPLVYLHGSGNIIPGLESALAGKGEGESLKVTVSPEDAYGDRDEDLMQTVPKSHFGDEELEVGMQFQARGPEGPVLLTIVRVLADTVTLDANHPLAGKTLSFDVTVLSVRDATLEELTHGHVHGPGGHHHH